MDYNNTVYYSGSTEVNYTSGSSGLDYCFYSPKSGSFSNLDTAQNFIDTQYKNLSNWLSKADVEILATQVAIEAWHNGP